jgi:hypothetical protein
MRRPARRLVVLLSTVVVFLSSACTLSEESSIQGTISEVAGSCSEVTLAVTVDDSEGLGDLLVAGERVTVVTNKATEFRRGVCNDLKNGVKIEVRGDPPVERKVTAKRVEVIP